MQSITGATAEGVSVIRPGGTSAANHPSIQMAGGAQALHESRQAPVVQPSNAPRANDPQLLVFMRHGETEDNCEAGQRYTMPDGSEHVSEGKRLSGWNHARLTALGLEQGGQAGLEMVDNFGRERLARGVYLCSPQPRAQGTFGAYSISAGIAESPLEKVDDPAFMERSAGKLTSMTWAEAGKHWPELQLGKQAGVFHLANMEYPGGIAKDGRHYKGESLVDVANRAAPALDAHIAAAGGKDIFVFAHELTIKALLTHVETGCTNHMENWCTNNETFKQVVPNAKPIVFVRTGNGWVRLDNRDQRRPGGTQAGEASRMAA